MVVTPIKAGRCGVDEGGSRMPEMTIMTRAPSLAEGSTVLVPPVNAAMDVEDYLDAPATTLDLTKYATLEGLRHMDATGPQEETLGALIGLGQSTVTRLLPMQAMDKALMEEMEPAALQQAT